MRGAERPSPTSPVGPSRAHPWSGGSLRWSCAGSHDALRTRHGCATQSIQGQRRPQTRGRPPRSTRRSQGRLPQRRELAEVQPPPPPVQQASRMRRHSAPLTGHALTAPIAPRGCDARCPSSAGMGISRSSCSRDRAWNMRCRRIGRTAGSAVGTLHCHRQRQEMCPPGRRPRMHCPVWMTTASKLPPSSPWWACWRHWRE